MQVVIVDTPAEVGRLAAAKISHLVRNRPDAVLGLATGSSPLAIYAELTREVADNGLDCSQVRAFA
jgi:glucosamine-6-phosphate deaminase